MQRKPQIAVLLLVAGLLVAGRAQAPPSTAKAASRPAGEPIRLQIPLGLPPLAVPGDNPPTQATVALGRKLFYDPRLSRDETVSCSTCHDPRRGFADSHGVAVGVDGKHGTRHAPSIANVAYFPEHFWDGRVDSLEKQAEAPVENPLEMAHSLGGVEQRLNADAAYRALFEQAWGAGAITYEKVAKSLASFERALLVANSPFDRWFFGHDEAAVNEAVKRGFQIFRDPARGNCAACHSVSDGSALFTDGKFHNTGISYWEGNPRDPGRFAVTRADADMGAFKTPSLRNVARTAPYMHDGSLKTLDEVVNFYSGGGNLNPHLDLKLHAGRFSTSDRDDLIEFLKSLTGDVPWSALPPRKSD